MESLSLNPHGNNKLNKLNVFIIEGFPYLHNFNKKSPEFLSLIHMHANNWVNMSEIVEFENFTKNRQGGTKM